MWKHPVVNVSMVKHVMGDRQSPFTVNWVVSVSNTQSLSQLVLLHTHIALRQRTQHTSQVVFPSLVHNLVLVMWCACVSPLAVTKSAYSTIRSNVHCNTNDIMILKQKLGSDLITIVTYRNNWLVETWNLNYPAGSPEGTYDLLHTDSYTNCICIK